MAGGKERWARSARNVALRPFVVGCEDKGEVAVSYHDVPVPRAAEACNLCRQLAGLGQEMGMADVTAAVDMAMRFSCLAYRRNSGRLAPSCLVLAPSESGTGLAVLSDGSCISAAEAVECQFSTPSGAHAVLYLLREPAPASETGERPSAGCAREAGARAVVHGACSHEDSCDGSSEAYATMRDSGTGLGEHPREGGPERRRRNGRSRVVAVLAFKGSTLVSPGSAPLSDWRANLSVLLPSFARAATIAAVGTSVPVAAAARAAGSVLPQPQGVQGQPPIAIEGRNAQGRAGRGEAGGGGGSAGGRGGGGCGDSGGGGRRGDCGSDCRGVGGVGACDGGNTDGGGTGGGGANGGGLGGGVWASSGRAGGGWVSNEGASGLWGAAHAAADAGVHPGFIAYYGELVASFRRLECGAIGEALCRAWGLPAHMTIWELLHSTHIEVLLCVGHSLGGALASLAATHIGASTAEIAPQTDAGHASAHYPDHTSSPHVRAPSSLHVSTGGHAPPSDHALSPPDHSIAPLGHMSSSPTRVPSSLHVTTAGHPPQPQSYRAFSPPDHATPPLGHATSSTSPVPCPLHVPTPVAPPPWANPSASHASTEPVYNKTSRAVRCSPSPAHADDYPNACVASPLHIPTPAAPPPWAYPAANDSPTRPSRIQTCDAIQSSASRAHADEPLARCIPTTASSPPALAAATPTQTSNAIKPPASPAHADGPPAHRVPNVPSFRPAPTSNTSTSTVCATCVPNTTSSSPAFAAALPASADAACVPTAKASSPVFAAAAPTSTASKGSANAAFPHLSARPDTTIPHTRPPAPATTPAPHAGPTPPRRLPCLVTFGCPIVGGAAFVQEQTRCVIPQGGLRVYNVHDPVVSVGHGLLSFTTATGGDCGRHAGHPILLRNDALTTANPYTNHLRYVLDSFELFPSNPCAHVRYALPGIVYTPDADARAIAQSPQHFPPGARSSPASWPASASFVRSVRFRAAAGGGGFGGAEAGGEGESGEGGVTPPGASVSPSLGQLCPAAAAAPSEPAGSVCVERAAVYAACKREVEGGDSFSTESSNLTDEAERLSAEAVATDAASGRETAAASSFLSESSSLPTKTERPSAGAASEREVVRETAGAGSFFSESSSLATKAERLSAGAASEREVRRKVAGAGYYFSESSSLTAEAERLSAGAVATNAASGRGLKAAGSAAGSYCSESGSLTAEAERLSAGAVASLAWTAERARSFLWWGDGLGGQSTDGAPHKRRGTSPADDGAHSKDRGVPAATDGAFHKRQGMSPANDGALLKEKGAPLAGSTPPPLEGEAPTGAVTEASVGAAAVCGDAPGPDYPPDISRLADIATDAELVGAATLCGDAFTPEPDHPAHTAAAAESVAVAVADVVAEFEMVPAVIADEDGTPIAKNGTPIAENGTPITENGTAVAENGMTVAEDITAVAEDMKALGESQLWRGGPVALRQRWAGLWGAGAAVAAADAPGGAACGGEGNNVEYSTLSQAGADDIDQSIKEAATSCRRVQDADMVGLQTGMQQA